MSDPRNVLRELHKSPLATAAHQSQDVVATPPNPAPAPVKNQGCNLSGNGQAEPFDRLVDWLRDHPVAASLGSLFALSMMTGNASDPSIYYLCVLAGLWGFLK